MLNGGDSNASALPMPVITAPDLPSAMIPRESLNACKMCRRWQTLSGTVCIRVLLGVWGQRKADSDTATSPVATELRTSGSGIDDLPPFALLTTDEEREKKAESTSPGTYNVVVNPESFQDLPEYHDDADVKGLLLSPLRSGSQGASNVGSQGTNSGVDNAHHGTDDPDVVILRRFEDATRRATSQLKDSRSTGSPLITRTSSEVSPPKLESHIDFDSASSFMQLAAEGGQDLNLLHHFRHHVWRHLAPVEHERTAQGSTFPENSGVEVLEHAAGLFPPVSLVPSALLRLSHVLAKARGSEE